MSRVARAVRAAALEQSWQLRYTVAPDRQAWLDAEQSRYWQRRLLRAATEFPEWKRDVAPRGPGVGMWWRDKLRTIDGRRA